MVVRIGAERVESVFATQKATSERGDVDIIAFRRCARTTSGFIHVLFTLIFGGLFYKNSLTDVPIIVCNLDDGLSSQELIRDLYDTPEVAIKFVRM